MLLFCCGVMFLVMPRAAASDRTITVAEGDDLRQAVADARDGDTIVLNGSVLINDDTSKDAPWVIDKAVTIQGGTLNLWVGGIILNADVSFRNMEISFGGFIRNAIMANGHTLILEDVSCAAGARPLHLFCGGLYGSNGAEGTPGKEGKIILRGAVSLEGDDAVGNLYAGNLCMGGLNPTDSHINGPANQFNGNASILLECSGGSIGCIYAGGAQQKIPEGSESGKVMLTDPEKYTVTGRVDIHLRDGKVSQVDGTGAGEVNVTYNGSEYLNGNLYLREISSLTVESGYLIPAPGSFREGAAAAVASGAKLGLLNFGDLTLGGFSGGGTLLLGEEQTMTVTGTVTGSTAVSICGSSGYPVRPLEGHTYISAPQSAANAFLLEPSDNWSSMQLLRDTNGNWAIVAGAEEILVESFSFQESAVSLNSGEKVAELSTKVIYAQNSAFLSYLFYVPLAIYVNGVPALGEMTADEYYSYVAQDGRMRIEMTEADRLSVTGVDDNAISDGTYFIEVVVPETNTGSGQTIWAGVTLIVGNSGSQQPELPYAIESIAVTDNAVTVSVTRLSSAEGGVVYAAAYGEDGRLRGVAAAPVKEDQVAVPLNSDGAQRVGVFIINSEEMRPLCVNRSISKN